MTQVKEDRALANRLPKFLQTRAGGSGLAGGAGESAPKARATAIFRAAAPVLTAPATAHSRAPAQIFHSRAPVLIPAAEGGAGSAAAPEPEGEEPPRPRGRHRPKARPQSPPPSPPPADSAAGFRILPLPRLAQGGRWRTEAMRSHSMPVLLWFTRGQGRITIAGVTRGYGAHNCIWLPPGTMHGFEMNGQVYGNCVFFPRGTTLPLPDRPLHLRFRDAAEHNELTQLIDNIQREIDRSLPARDRAIDHHAGLLAVWLERQSEALVRDELSDTAARRLSAAYTALVEKRFRDGLSVAEFAAALGVTPTHLSRSCNAACGRSAHDILADRIFFEARHLLRETRAPVQEIAGALGFTSAAYFSRAFQKATGETPTGFRGPRRG